MNVDDRDSRKEWELKQLPEIFHDVSGKERLKMNLSSSLAAINAPVELLTAEESTLLHAHRAIEAYKATQPAVMEASKTLDMPEVKTRGWFNKFGIFSGKEKETPDRVLDKTIRKSR